jgi:hypothetical protein
MEWKNSPLYHGNKKREFVGFGNDSAKDKQKNLFLSALLDDSHGSLPTSSLFDDDADHVIDAISQHVVNEDAVSVVEEGDRVIDASNVDTTVFDSIIQEESNVKIMDDDLQKFRDHITQVENEFPPLSSIVSVASAFLSADDLVAHIRRKVSY